MDNIQNHYNFILEMFKYFGDNFGVFGIVSQSIFIIIIFLMIQQFKLSGQMNRYTNKFEVQIQTIQSITQFLDVSVKTVLDRVQEYEDIIQLFENYLGVSISNIIDIIQDNMNSNRYFSEEEIKSVLYRFQVRILTSTQEIMIYLNVDSKDQILDLTNRIEKIFINRIKMKFTNGISEELIKEVKKQFEIFRQSLNKS